ncbi:hypothetical protein [Microbacterium gilvum]|uniref:Tetratricopeptide repeat protein n=1 Tax=Microbacterium gilvum TaxID=1336204 RepID=A0ABP9A528_9MICO
MSSQMDIDYGGRIPLPRVRADARAAVLDEIVGIQLDFEAGASLEHPASDAPGHLASLSLVSIVAEELVDGDVTTALQAQVTWMALWPGIPEMLAIGIAFGGAAADRNRLDMLRLDARAQARGLSLDEYIARLREADAMPRSPFVRMFRGETRRAPSEERIERGLTVLDETLALVPTLQRPPLLCTSAWLHWARGRWGEAMLHLAEAARIEPRHELAYGLSIRLSELTPAWLAE